MSNSLAAVHPELIVEWSDRNLPLTPDSVTFGSNKKVWWKGACGHEWETSVKARSNGEKCPICSGAKVVSGINDLSTLKPELTSEWSEKNKIKPTEVSIGSHKKVIWKCKLGHEWAATVKSRTINKTGCPYCSHNKVLAGFNDLATVLPEVAAEWSDRNEKKPTEVTSFANSKAWWKCETCGYEWNTLISTRSYGSKCPCCSGYVLVKGRNDLKTTHPNIAEEWSEQNFPLQPDEVNAKSRKNVWWHCNQCGNEWKSVINSRVKGTVCPVCAERAVLAGYNDLATTDRKLLAEWDYELNKLKPTEVSRSSAKRAWWKCRYGHSWSMKINERTVLEKGCRECKQEYRSLFPAFAISYYAKMKGLKIELGSDRLLGIPIDVYIPSEQVTIEVNLATNIGKVPIEDYREIVAVQNGFDSYDEMYNEGIRIGNGYDKEPEPIVPAWEQKKKSKVKSFDLHPNIPMAERYNFDLANNEVEQVGKKERFRRNIMAIQLLKKCQEENRFATPEEQIILSKYVGWGGIPEAFDERNSAWSTEYLELSSVLTPDEYAAARESTLTAFYTPPEVSTAIYKALEQMGFQEGNLLEPSCGIGNFIGMLPKSMENAKVYGVELDTISAGIAQQL